jgi:hypothetical protein
MPYPKFRRDDMAIQDRNLTPGTALVAKYKGETYQAEVVETEAGLRYRLSDGREFKSPSSAGSAVMDGKACNGWSFWSLASGPTTALATSSTRRATARPRAKKGAEADASAGEATDASVGVTCAECGERFASPEAATAHFQEVHPA